MLNGMYIFDYRQTVLVVLIYKYNKIINLKCIIGDKVMNKIFDALMRHAEQICEYKTEQMKGMFTVMDNLVTDNKNTEKNTTNKA